MTFIAFVSWPVLAIIWVLTFLVRHWRGTIWCALAAGAAGGTMDHDWSGVVLLGLLLAGYSALLTRFA